MRLRSFSPRLSDDVVRALYREGRCRRMPMTRLADELLRQALGGGEGSSPWLHALEDGSDPWAPARFPERGAA